MTRQDSDKSRFLSAPNLVSDTVIVPNITRVSEPRLYGLDEIIEPKCLFSSDYFKINRDIGDYIQMTQFWEPSQILEYSSVYGTINKVNAIH